MPFDGSRLDLTTRILINGRDRLERDGWCRGMLVDHLGRVCMMGALGYDGPTATITLSRRSPRTRAVLRLARALGFSTALDEDVPKAVVTWNDASRRTRKQVLEVFDRAIAGI